MEAHQPAILAVDDEPTVLAAVARGGSLMLESEPGRTVFRARLPMQPAVR